MTAGGNPDPAPGRALRWGVAVTVLATALRLVWVLAVPTVPVSDFAMYRESANYLSEFGSLDHGFIYMPGFVVLLAAVKNLGGDLLAQKLLGVFFGGLGAAGVFATALHLLDVDAHGQRRGCATAIGAGLLYALWPAGIALGSVVGTDVPAAALMLVATGCLGALGERRRPWVAALVFGAVMGLASYLRAVALPLTALSAFYWLGNPGRVPEPSREGLRSGQARPPSTRSRLLRAIKMTALSVATTLLVLSPWAIRNRLHEGELFFTDCHGGITALIGTNPNSEGTYTRALNQLFKNVTGRSVLDEPHRQVDHAAYRLAKDWARFEPAYALGLATLRAERLFDDEHLLLYWPIYRAGVLVPPRDAFFERHRTAITGACDAVGIGILVAFLAGLALAAVQRRARAFVLLPFQAALAATYIVFFAEPRYRVPIEMLAMPVAAFALVGFARLGVAAVRGNQESRRRLGLAALAAAVLIAGVCSLAPRAQAMGARLRAQHRWAVTAWNVDGQTRIARWRRSAGDLAVVAGSDVLRGAPDGVRVRPHPTGATTLDVALDGGDLPAGDYHLQATVNAAAESTLTVAIAAAPAPAITLRVSTGAIPETTLAGAVHHNGGPFRLTVTATGAGSVAGGDSTTRASASTNDIWIGTVTLARQAAPAP